MFAARPLPPSRASSSPTSTSSLATLPAIRVRHSSVAHLWLVLIPPGSNSEIVVPLVVAGQVRGVLDLDNKALEGFDRADLAALERIVQDLIVPLDWSQISN